jgi:hypothetical protein
VRVFHPGRLVCFLFPHLFFFVFFWIVACAPRSEEGTNKKQRVRTARVFVCSSFGVMLQTTKRKDAPSRAPSRCPSPADKRARDAAVQVHVDARRTPCSPCRVDGLVNCTHDDAPAVSPATLLAEQLHIDDVSMHDDAPPSDVVHWRAPQPRAPDATRSVSPRASIAMPVAERSPHTPRAASPSVIAAPAAPAAPVAPRQAVPHAPSVAPRPPPAERDTTIAAAPPTVPADVPHTTHAALHATVRAVDAMPALEAATAAPALPPVHRIPHVAPRARAVPADAVPVDAVPTLAAPVMHVASHTVRAVLPRTVSPRVVPPPEPRIVRGVPPHDARTQALVARRMQRAPPCAACAVHAKEVAGMKRQIAALEKARVFAFVLATLMLLWGACIGMLSARAL